MKLLKIILLLLALVTGAVSQSGYRPKSGFIPNQETAVKVAEAILIPVYGEKQVVSERPYQAQLDGDVWTVSGTLYCGDPPRRSSSCNGGTAVVKLSKRDGRVLFMIHYQ